MFLRYMANIVEKTFEFSQQERNSWSPAHSHTHKQKHTKKQRNKENKKNRTQDFLPFSKVGHRPHLAFSDSLIDEQ